MTSITRDGQVDFRFPPKRCIGLRRRRLQRLGTQLKKKAKQVA